MSDERNRITTLTAPSVDDIPPCPAGGEGVHEWIWDAAITCRSLGHPQNDAHSFIAARLTRPPRPAREIDDALNKIYRGGGNTGSPHIRVASPSGKAPVKISAINFDPDRLAAVASRIPAPANWRHWLWERSLKRPEAMNAISFLAHLYRPGERVHLFDDMEAWKPTATAEITQPMDCRLPAEIRNGGKGLGIWYLCNPVDGQWHPNPRQGGQSCRSEESITSVRYAVLESDQADPSHWLAFIVQLPLRIAAIYTSGGKSIHALVRVDAESKADWDAKAAPFKRPFKALGGDAKSLSAVRLTRLPGCRRPEKNGFQRLLYLAPCPPEAPLWELPKLWDRAESLARWKTICPRWQEGTEADQ